MHRLWVVPPPRLSTKTTIQRPLTTSAVRRRRIQQVRKQDEYPFGLNPVDYSKPPPIAPMLIPPPQKRGFQRLLAPFNLLLFVGFGVYLLFNNDTETHEYWKRVETGQVLIDDDEDDDDDEEDDEE
jgi:hypothetical protein